MTINEGKTVVHGTELLFSNDMVERKMWAGGQAGYAKAISLTGGVKQISMVATARVI